MRKHVPEITKKTTSPQTPTLCLCDGRPAGSILPTPEILDPLESAVPGSSAGLALWLFGLMAWDYFADHHTEAGVRGVF